MSKKDYVYLFFGLLIFVASILGGTIEFMLSNDYYNSAMYHATAEKEGEERITHLRSLEIEEYNKSHQIHIYYDLGITLNHIGRTAEAERYLIKVLTIHPTAIRKYLMGDNDFRELHNNAYLILARIALDENDTRNAETYIKGLDDYEYMGWCGTMALRSHDEINQLKRDYALAVGEEVEEESLK